MQLEHSYAQLPDRFHAVAPPQAARAPKLLAWNAVLASELGLEWLGPQQAETAQIFSGGPLPEEFAPIALAYAGHQFGHFVPQLGDGRAVLIGEVTSSSGQRFDIQLKGSGRTPFSRGGDGRSWLGPVIREYLLSEAMHRLGVPTTRALAAVATGEEVYRDEPLPGGVFTRVASSHLRIGTFQFFAARKDTEALQTLTDYAIDRHYPEARDAPIPAAAFLTAVVARQARLVAHWMSIGFIHGVMNTDNTSIAGETLDYGPCAFMDEFHFDKVFSSIDQHGRYAYGNQPGIAQWNLARLAECLLMICDDQPAFEAALAEFPDRFQAHWLKLMGKKLGIADAASEDIALIHGWLEHLQNNHLDFTLSFRELADQLSTDGEARFGEFESVWRQRVLGQGVEPEVIAGAMNRVNPLYIPRNHRVEQAIASAVEGDFSMFEEMHAVLESPYVEQREFAHYAKAPQPSERVMQTFCGT